MASWLYSLLIGLGISSGGVAFIGMFIGLALLMIFFDERGRARTLGIVVLIMIPILAVASIVLLSITYSIHIRNTSTLFEKTKRLYAGVFRYIRQKARRFCKSRGEK